MHVRELEPRDEDGLAAFFAAIPAADRAFFKEELDDPAVLRRWIDDDRSVRLIAAEETGEIAAVVAVWPGIGRSAHVGDLRLVVGAGHRGQGVGQRMARAALTEALRRGIWRLTVEVVATQQGTIDMFLALGFQPEALLRDHLWTPGGEAEDVVLLAHLAEEAGHGLTLAAPIPPHEAPAVPDAPRRGGVLARGAGRPSRRRAHRGGGRAGARGGAGAGLRALRPRDHQRADAHDPHGGARRRAGLRGAALGGRPGTFLGHLEQSAACLNVIDDGYVRAVNVTPYDVAHLSSRSTTLEEMLEQYRA